MANSDHAGPRAASRGLSLNRIVTETLALIDEQGIALASMRSVGDRMGVRAMSLYRYVASREELFDAVVERIVDELGVDPEVSTDAEHGWRDYLERLAWGVRRYALAHPHAFPLVATRPPDAPWLNPPLRSLRWVEAMLHALRAEGFTDDQILFTYRAFNSFLLGYLLLETSALTLRDPKPGDGSFQQAPAVDGTDPVDPADPVPGALSPSRDAAARTTGPGGGAAQPNGVDRERYPMIFELRDGLTQDRYTDEFTLGLHELLDRVAALVAVD